VIPRGLKIAWIVAVLLCAGGFVLSATIIPDNPLMAAAALPSLALGSWIVFRRKADTVDSSPPDISPVPEPVAMEPAASEPAAPEPREEERETDDHRLVLSRIYDEAGFYRTCLKRLGDSTTENLLTMTTPISEETLTIKETIVGFVAKVKENDREIASQSTARWIEEKRLEVKDDIDRVACTVQEGFAGFGANLDVIDGIMKSIMQTTSQIEDVAQLVNILSINAAIEAARAGNSGKGFKVIADNIRSLSNETSGITERIHKTVGQTVGTFQTIRRELDRRRADIEGMLSSQQRNFGEFYEVFDRHDRQFVELYRDIMGFIDRMSGMMHALSPLAQLHEITVQEMQNLALVQDDYLDDLRNGLSGARADGGNGIADYAALAERVRLRLTTARELDALQAAASSVGVTDLDLRRSDKSIEFF